MNFQSLIKITEYSECSELKEFFLGYSRNENENEYKRIRDI
jgi:hypothetical protein